MKFADLKNSKYFVDLSNDSLEAYGIDLDVREKGYKVLLFGELDNDVWEINNDDFMGHVVVKFANDDDTVTFKLDEDIPLSVVKVTVEPIETL